MNCYLEVSFIFLTSGIIHLVCLLDPELIPINILVLVPWPDSREYAGWDVGLELLPGARIAVEEINTRPDLLAGHKLNIIEAGHDACGLTEHSLGLTNLIREAVDPLKPYNVVAVTGLFCSSNTLALSPVAGRDGIDLIQIAGSYSPIFKTTNRNHFPHLWRLVQSADVHAELMIYLAQQYDWSRIAVVSNTENAFYNGIARSLVTMLENVEVVHEGSLVKRIENFQTQVLDDLITSNARIIFLSAESGQIADLVCAAFKAGMIYPNYLWVIADWTINTILNEQNIDCSKDELKLALEGSIFFYFRFLPSDNSTSNYRYTLFEENYAKELIAVQEEYKELIEATNASVSGDLEYASVLYHQIYAISYALNNSLPKLKANNISIDTYGFGQPDVTSIIEESLKEIRFTGFTGEITFDRYNEVDTPVNVFQVIEGMSVVIGSVQNVSNITPGTLNPQFDPRLDDKIPSLYQTIDPYLTSTLTLLVTALFVLVTVLLFLILKYRNVKQIKANSVKVSMLMFIACYIFITADVVIIILCSVQLTMLAYSTLCNFMYFLIYNAFILLFSTQLAKQRRIHRIFNNTAFKVYSWRYTNWVVALKITGFCLVGNVIWLINISIQPARRNFIETFEYRKGITTQFLYPYCDAGISDYLFYLLYLYLAILLFMNIYFASRAKKTMQRDFRNTKLINLCMVIVFIILLLSLPFREVFFVNNKHVLYLNVVIFFCTLIPAALSQIILFLPSVLYSLKDKGIFQSNFISRLSLVPTDSK